MSVAVSVDHAAGWPLACPSCRGPLVAGTPGPVTQWSCAGCASAYPVRDGILRLLTAADADAAERFLSGYRRVRTAEGWGSDDRAWLRGLPVVSATDPHAHIWRIRARSFHALTTRVLADLVAGARLLDVGAGNGWLSARLASRGLVPMAVDLNDDPRDGLGAGRYLGQGDAPPSWPRVQASFDRLPLPDGTADVVVFNASLHYSGDLQATLQEARRVLRPDGRVVIMDSPVYRDASSGAAMVAERTRDLERRYGAPGATDGGIGYLTWAGLEAAAAVSGVRWSVVRPWYGIRWAIRPVRARIRGAREPATFAIVVGTWTGT